MVSEDVEMDVYRLLPQNRGDIRVRNCRRLCGAGNFGTASFSDGLLAIVTGLAVRGFITPGDARRIRQEIHETLRPDDPDSPRRSLLLVGKSAGGISLWNTLRLHFDEITGWVVRCALVLIDPHGNAWGDDVGSYSAGQKLTCPRNWSSDPSRFRVYNIFQQRFPGMGGHLTGASFPGAFLNEQLFDTRPINRRQPSEGGLYHMTMMQHPRVQDVILKGYLFARTGT